MDFEGDLPAATIIISYMALQLICLKVIQKCDPLAPLKKFLMKPDGIADHQYVRLTTENELRQARRERLGRETMPLVSDE